MNPMIRIIVVFILPLIIITMYFPNHSFYEKAVLVNLMTITNLLAWPNK